MVEAESWLPAAASREILRQKAANSNIDTKRT